MSDDLLIVATDRTKVQAFDGRDGSLRWDRTTNHPFGGLGLAQSADAIIAASLDGYLCSLQASDGSVRWETSISGVATNIDESGHRVAATLSHIAVQDGQRIIVLDAQQGITLWERMIPSTSRMGWLVAIGESNVYIVERPGVLSPLPSGELSEQQTRIGSRSAPTSWLTTAFSVQTGTPVWSTTQRTAVEPAWDAGSSLVEADGIVYTCGMGIYALNAMTGAVIWSNETAPHFHVATVDVGETDLATCLGYQFGMYHRDTGAMAWSLAGRREGNGYFEEYDSAVVLDREDAVCVGRVAFNPDGFHLDVYDMNSGAARWTWPNERSASPSGWRFRAAGDTIYVPDQGSIYSIRARDGKDLWQRKIKGSSYSLLAITR